MNLQHTGTKTTEFWFSAGLALLNTALGLAGQVDPNYAVLGNGVIGGLYSIARALAKGGVLRGTVGDVLKQDATK